MFKVISIGSALVDIFIHSDNFQATETEGGKQLCQAYGDKIEVEKFSVYTGGGGSNTAVAFARMGFKTGIICETGRDRFAYLVMQDLQENGVDRRMVIEEKKEQTGGSVILVGPDGERTVMVHRGASSLLDPFDISTYWLTQTEWVHLSSIAGRQQALDKIFTAVSNSDYVKMSWNPGKAELNLMAEGKLPLKDIPCEILFVNKQEWQMLEDVQEEALASFPQILVTNGKKGGELYLEGSHELDFDSNGVQAVDSTGAGDAFASGYVSGQLLNKNPEKSIKIGVENAGSVIRFYGAKAGLLTRDRISDL